MRTNTAHASINTSHPLSPFMATPHETRDHIPIQDTCAYNTTNKQTLKIVLHQSSGLSSTGKDGKTNNDGEYISLSISYRGEGI